MKDSIFVVLVLSVVLGMVISFFAPKNKNPKVTTSDSSKVNVSSK